MSCGCARFCRAKFRQAESGHAWYRLGQLNLIGLPLNFGNAASSHVVFSSLCLRHVQQGGARFGVPMFYWSQSSIHVRWGSVYHSVVRQSFVVLSIVWYGTGRSKISGAITKISGSAACRAVYYSGLRSGPVDCQYCPVTCGAV